MIYLVVSTPLKNISQNESSPQVRMKMNNIWNHHELAVRAEDTSFAVFEACAWLGDANSRSLAVVSRSSRSSNMGRWTAWRQLCKMRRKCWKRVRLKFKSHSTFQRQNDVDKPNDHWSLATCTVHAVIKLFHQKQLRVGRILSISLF